MKLLPAASLLTLWGCAPQLYSPEASEDSGCDWTAPENTWVSHTPPDCLQGEGLRRGQTATDILGPDQHGDTARLWQFYGDLIVLDLSAMWCRPCQLLATTVDETAHDYRDQGVQYLTLIVSGELSETPPSQLDAEEWSENFGVSEPVIADTEAWHRQLFPTGQLELPRVLLIGRDMRVIEPEIWPPNDVGIRQAIEANL